MAIRHRPRPVSAQVEALLGRALGFPCIVIALAAVVGTVVATVVAVIAAVKGAVEPWPAEAAVKAGVCSVEAAINARMVRPIESAV